MPILPNNNLMQSNQQFYQQHNQQNFFTPKISAPINYNNINATNSLASTLQQPSTSTSYNFINQQVLNQSSHQSNMIDVQQQQQQQQQAQRHIIQDSQQQQQQEKILQHQFHTGQKVSTSSVNRRQIIDSMSQSPYAFPSATFRRVKDDKTTFNV